MDRKGAFAVLPASASCISTRSRSSDALIVGLDDIHLVVDDQIMQEVAEGKQGESDNIVVVSLNRAHQQRSATLWK